MASAVAVNRNFTKAVERRCDNAFRYILGAIRRRAIKMIRVQTLTNPHSKPGEAVRTRRPATVYKNTIERDYNPRTKVGICGPIRTFKNANADTRPAVGGPFGGKNTVPRLLEYGGLMVATRPQLFLTKKVPKQFRQKLKSDRRKNAKWTVIKPGVYTVEARPTMRLAFNETVLQTNKTLVEAFRRTGVVDPPSLQKVI